MRVSTVAVTVALLLVLGCSPGGRTGSGPLYLRPAKSSTNEDFGAHTPERIIAECTRAIMHDSACAWAYYYRALAWATFGVEDEARKDMDRAMQLKDAYRKEYGEFRKMLATPFPGREHFTSDTPRYYLSSQSALSPDPVIQVVRSINTADSYSSVVPPRNSSDPRGTLESTIVSAAPESSGSPNSGGSAEKGSTGQKDSAENVHTSGSSDKTGQRNKYIQSLIEQEINSTGKRESLSEIDRQKRRAFLPGRKRDTEGRNRDSAGLKTSTENDGLDTVRHSEKDTSSSNRHPGAPSRDECPELVMGDTVTVYFCLAKMYYKHKEYKKALFALNQIIERERGHSEAYLWKAKTLGAQSKYWKALRAVNRSIKITSTNPKAYSIRAWIHHCRGRYRKEAENLREALKLGYDKPDIIRVRLDAIADKLD